MQPPSSWTASRCVAMRSETIPVRSRLGSAASASARLEVIPLQDTQVRDSPHRRSARHEARPPHARHRGAPRSRPWTVEAAPGTEARWRAPCQPPAPPGGAPTGPPPLTPTGDAPFPRPRRRGSASGAPSPSGRPAPRADHRAAPRPAAGPACPSTTIEHPAKVPSRSLPCRALDSSVGYAAAIDLATSTRAPRSPWSTPRDTPCPTNNRSSCAPPLRVARARRAVGLTGMPPAAQRRSSALSRAACRVR
jgi:hypothetical protein